MSIEMAGQGRMNLETDLCLNTEQERSRLQCSAWDALQDKQLRVWLMTRHKVSHTRLSTLVAVAQSITSSHQHSAISPRQPREGRIAPRLDRRLRHRVGRLEGGTGPIAAPALRFHPCLHSVALTRAGTSPQHHPVLRSVAAQTNQTSLAFPSPTSS